MNNNKTICESCDNVVTESSLDNRAASDGRYPVHNRNNNASVASLTGALHIINILYYFLKKLSIFSLDFMLNEPFQQSFAMSLHLLHNIIETQRSQMLQSLISTDIKQ